jgi:hypothetical protein
MSVDRNEKIWAYGATANGTRMHAFVETGSQGTKRAMCRKNIERAASTPFVGHESADSFCTRCMKLAVAMWDRAEASMAPSQDVDPQAYADHFETDDLSYVAPVADWDEVAAALDSPDVMDALHAEALELDVRLMDRLHTQALDINVAHDIAQRPATVDFTELTPTGVQRSGRWSMTDVPRTMTGEERAHHKSVAGYVEAYGFMAQNQAGSDMDGLRAFLDQDTAVEPVPAPAEEYGPLRDLLRFAQD